MNSKMLGVVATSTPTVLSSTTKSSTKNSNPRLCFAERFPTNPSLLLNRTHTFSLLSIYFSLQKNTRFHTQFSPKSASSSSVGSAEYTEEPATKEKFQTSLSHPGCTSPLSLLGTGYREKVFAIIGVKVYAAGLYVNKSVLSRLNTWKGRLAAEIQADPSLFDTVFLAPEEKSLHIVLVRDVDGKTFWDALDEAISPRIKSPTRVDESALSTFRSIFEGRSLNKGTSIFLTWLDPGKMLVCVSSDGLPSSVDATIDSRSVTSALFDVFFGGDPVSPSLKASVATGFATILI